MFIGTPCSIHHLKFLKYDPGKKSTKTSGRNLSSNLRDIKGIINIISIHNVTLCAFSAISYL